MFIVNNYSRADSISHALEKAIKSFSKDKANTILDTDTNFCVVNTWEDSLLSHNTLIGNNIVTR